MAFTPLPGTRAPVRVWTDPYGIEPQAAQQLRNIGALPWVQGVARDARRALRQGRDRRLGHRDAAGAVSPAAVGVDIGCGMIGGPHLADRRRPARRPRAGCARAIEAAIPVGFAAARRRRSTRAGSAAWSSAAGTASGAGFGDLRPAGGAAARAGRSSSWARSAAATTSSRSASTSRRRPGVADAALRVPQHRQGAGRAAHRRSPGSCRTTPTCPTGTWRCSSPAPRRWTPTAGTCTGRRSTRGATGR